jgi:DNA-directed RNA polymerase subunit RPC12/RpoP
MPPPCERCEADCWEFIEDDLTECVFCGVRRRVKRRRPALPPAAEYRFGSGRFSGMSIPEVDAQPYGRKYLELVAPDNHRVEEYLMKTNGAV